MNILEKRVVKALRPSLEKSRFRWVSSREMFIRAENFGYCAVVWTAHRDLTDNAVGTTFTPFLTLRQTIVEDLVNGLDVMYGTDNQKYSPTVVRAGATSAPSGDFKFFLNADAQDAEVEAAASEVTRIVFHSEVPFYAHFSSLLACSQGLNSNPEQVIHPLGRDFATRVYHGIVCAKLSEPERVDSLVMSYRRAALTLGRPSQIIIENIGKLLATFDKLDVESDLSA
ncbi:hypothetical protein ACVWWJ_001872 [Luteibacter sp. HA06]